MRFRQARLRSPKECLSNYGSHTELRSPILLFPGSARKRLVAAASPCKKACLLPCKAYNSASGLSRQFAHTKAYCSARGLFSPGRQTEREAVPYPFCSSSGGSAVDGLLPSSSLLYGNCWLAVSLLSRWTDARLTG